MHARVPGSTCMDLYYLDLVYTARALALEVHRIGSIDKTCANQIQATDDGGGRKTVAGRNIATRSSRGVQKVQQPCRWLCFLALTTTSLTFYYRHPTVELSLR